MPDQKTMRTSCLGGFLLCWYQNFFLLPWKLGFLAQKRPNSSQKMHLFSTYRSCWLFCCPVVVCRLYLARRLFALCICCKLANVANYLIFGVIFFALKNTVMDFLDKFQVCQWPDQKINMRSFDSCVHYTLPSLIVRLTLYNIKTLTPCMYDQI